MSALLFRRELIFPVHTRGTRFDHGTHEFVGVERTTKARLSIGNDWQHELDGILTVGSFGHRLRPLNLIGPAERIVDPPHHRRHGVHRVEALIGVDVFGKVGVSSHLPTRQVDGLKSGLGHLHGLSSGHGTERMHVVTAMEKFPQTIGAGLRG